MLYTLLAMSFALNIYFIREFLIERYARIQMIEEHAKSLSQIVQKSAFITEEAGRVVEHSRKTVAQNTKEVIKLRKMTADILQQAGMVMEIKNERALAISIYESVLSLNPDNNDEIRFRIELLKSQENPSQLLS